MKIFIINLPNAIERREFQKCQLLKLGLDYEFLNAISINDIEQDTYDKHFFDWQRPLRKEEVACYYSHKSAWQRIIESNKPALILEDDALLSRCVPELLKILEGRTKTDLINFEVRNRKKYVSKDGESIPPDSRLLRLHQDRCGAAGYVLWPAGAQKLLEAENKKGIALADAHITDCHELLAYQIEPAAIIQLDQCSHYGIQVAEAENISLTSISTSASSQGGASFRVKRIYSQLKLGIRQLLLTSEARKRHIDLVIEDFSHG
jgi:glycosyl transferase, family 25